LKDDNYIVIQGWMVNHLKLSGNELMVYAIIYGFSQDGESKYEGSGKYIADSVGISRRAVSLILNSLVEKGYIKKFDYTEKGVKLCNYQAAAEYLPSEKGQVAEKPQGGGMENISIGRKKIPYPETDQFEAAEEEKTTGGMENISIGRKNFPEGMEKDSIGGMENFANHITSYIDINTATAPQPPDSNADPPPAEQPAAAAPTPQIIQETIAGLDRTLVLSDDFYPKAAAFMAQNSLDIGYPAWLYRQGEIKKPASFDGWFFTVFFAANKAEKYKAERQMATSPLPPPPDAPCPVCGISHSPRDDICPACGLPKNAPEDRIWILRQLHEFPPDKRDEYLQREQAIGNECDLKDFAKYSALLANLHKEFGLETA